jgi:SAM-dependent methyltransferase
MGRGLEIRDMTENTSESENDPRRISLTDSNWRAIIPYLREHPEILLFDQLLRVNIAMWRAKEFDRTERWAGDQDNLVPFALSYNEGHMNRFLESHVVRLIRPLSIIDPVYENAATTKLLSIGPRNENELFHLRAYGFKMENIEAIDIVTNSPLVRVMDMHDMEFDDESFDVVMSGWTLPYSRDPKRALSEKMRVLRRNGLLCVGLTRALEDAQKTQELIESGATSYVSADQILEDIGPDRVEVAFKHEPLDPMRKGAILLILRKVG